MPHQKRTSSRSRFLKTGSAIDTSALLTQSSFQELEREFSEKSAERALLAFTDKGSTAERAFAHATPGGFRFTQGVQTEDIRRFLEDPEFIAGNLGSSDRGSLAERITTERIVRAKATKQAAELAEKQERAQSSLIRLQTQQKRRQEAGGLRSGILTSPRGLTGSRPNLLALRGSQ